ncbi:hypothetical protein CCACVL1_15044 [Corchorus capsularis]|uniref:Uncharacterized protein n=1 Tax=Corchorus capsularis TaxID=210143 RepID=A0A1R3I473_COCAP|nr:hypothetical protein CCACVL1_15044 [Corchorus capsularis]
MAIYRFLYSKKQSYRQREQK